MTALAPTRIEEHTIRAARRGWTGWHTFGMLLVVGGILSLGLLAPLHYRLETWLGILGLMFMFLLLVGHGITGLWMGVLVDERNKLSLSRLQMTLWLILILSAFLTAALSNVRMGHANSLAIGIPGELWLLMGISTTALVGSPLMKNAKRYKNPDSTEKERTTSLIAQQRGLQADSATEELMTTEGQIVVNRQPGEARWSDLFRGEEVSNAAQIDLAKVQMFYFTLMMLMAYGVTLGSMFMTSAGRIEAFPAVDASLIALLGISHAGYLGHKAVPHSKST